MKKHLIIFTVLLASIAYGQEGRVGINTTEPKATLDVTASATDLTRTDGIIAPKLTGDQLKAKDSNYTNDQTGAIVYATDASSDAGVTGKKTINVTGAGYYYFDGLVWVKFPAKYVEPWNVAGTNNPATSNSQDIYQMGKIGIGNSNPTAGIHILLNDYSSNFDDKFDDIHIESYAGNNVKTGNPHIYTSVARGTLDNPENLQFDDELLTIGSRVRYNNTFAFSSYLNSRYRGDGSNNLSDLLFVTSRSNRMIFDEYGNLGINTITPTAKLHVVKATGELTPAIIQGCNDYADNAAAVTAGLPIGALYRTGDILKVVH